MRPSVTTERVLLLAPSALAVAVTVGLLAGVVTVLSSSGPATASLGAASALSPGTAPTAPTGTAGATGATETTEVETLRRHTLEVPGDAAGWVALGLAELEQGRVSGDPARYAAADQAFGTALRLQPGSASALAGRAALADSRHDFATGLALADQALAADPGHPQALAARVDALTELGRYPEALAAAQSLDRARPGVASFSRLSYQAELRGDLAEAQRLMRLAADGAATPAQAAFARAHEGLLALAGGDPAGADRALRAGSAVAPDDPALLQLAARLAWAQGRREQAADLYAQLTARRPTASAAVAQAEVLAALGRPEQARQALALAQAAGRLAATAGVAPEGVDVLAEADHGDPGRALAQAEALWRRTRSTGAADAYAWALHVAGRDRQALAMADRALALGGRPALWLYHRGVIKAALRDRSGAIADLRAALDADPTFSPLHAPRAAQLLASLGGTR